MKQFSIIRIAGNQDGTFGVFFDEDQPFCLTLERQWLDNRKGESCIPDADYICKRINSPKFGNTFEICDVLGRSNIEFHKGNLMMDSHGCVIVGEQFEPLDGKNGVLASGKAFDEFLQRTKEIDEFKLTIMWVSVRR